MKGVSNISFHRQFPKEYFWVLLFIILASCTRHKLYDTEPTRVTVEFIPSIEEIATRISGNGWENGDAVGLFMLSGNGTLPADIIDEVENVKYVALIDGKHASLRPMRVEQTIYYPQDNTAVDFVAYYPYMEIGINDRELKDYIYPIRVDDQSKPGTIDLLYTTAKNRTTASNPVNLNFAHKLSKFRVQINHRPGSDISMLKDLKVILNNMPIAAGFSLIDTKFTYKNEDGESETGSILLRTVNVGLEYDGIIIPHSANTYPFRSILFTAPGVGGSTPFNYSWDISDDSFFLGGKEYTFIFMLEGSALKFAGITISDWGNVSISPTAIEMVTIPGGTFLMGSSDGSAVEPNNKEAEAGRGNDEILHEVTISDFRISRYPITNAQYLAFLNIRQVPSTGMQDGKKLIAIPHPHLKCTIVANTNNTDTYLWSVVEGKENHPVTHISWDGATAYTHWQGAKLPTEAQWEYACRAATKTPYHFDLTETALDKYAWYKNNNTGPEYESGAKSVGLKYHNPFGLNDMHGNVWEWCTDWYGPYSIPAAPNPVNNNNASGKHVLRGGAYDSPAEDCRSATRFAAEPDKVHANFGFRIAI